MEYLLFYLYVLRGYVFGALLLSAALALFLVSIRSSKRLSLHRFIFVLVIFFSAVVLIIWNQQYLRAMDPKYQQDHSRSLKLKEQKAASTHIDYPVYTYAISGSMRHEAAISNRAYPPLHVIYNLYVDDSHSDVGEEFVSMIEYQAGDQPYTLLELDSRGCENNMKCTHLNDTKFGPVYKVASHSSAEKYFSTDGTTNIFMLINESNNPDKIAVEVLNGLHAVKPADLPYR